MVEWNIDIVDPQIPHFFKKRKHLFDRNAVKTNVFEFQNSRQELIKTMTVLFILHAPYLAYSDGIN